MLRNLFLSRRYIQLLMVLTVCLGGAAWSAGRSRPAGRPSGGSRSSAPPVTPSAPAQTARSQPTISRQPTSLRMSRPMTPRPSMRSQPSPQRSRSAPTQSPMQSRVQTMRSMPSMPRSSTPSRATPNVHRYVQPSPSITPQSLQSSTPRLPITSSVPSMGQTQRVSPLSASLGLPARTIARQPTTARSMTPTRSTTSRQTLTPELSDRFVSPRSGSTSSFGVTPERQTQLRNRARTLPTTASAERSPSTTRSLPSTGREVRLNLSDRTTARPTIPRNPPVSVYRGDAAPSQRSRPSGVRPMPTSANTGSRAATDRASNTRVQMDQLRTRLHSARSPSLDGTDRSRDTGAGHQSNAAVPHRQSGARNQIVDDSHRRQQADRYRCRESQSRPYVYHDRPSQVSHRNRCDYTYYDSYRRQCHRLIWPQYRCRIRYSCGPQYYTRWHYPYYHRKYVFVSIGGYWPLSCNSMRYYWYGGHPYDWYGYYPMPRIQEGDTYNTYTYNYQDVADSYGVYGSSYETVNGPQATAAYADTAPSAIQSVPPTSATEADYRFETGVKAFEQGDFTAAVQAFQTAMTLAPDDVILPFAYSQALFALQDYDGAILALRSALTKSGAQQSTVGVYYPRGLYQDDNALYAQIDKLMSHIEKQGSHPDLQLLLGYHMLGIGETQSALEPLEQAQQNPDNAAAVAELKALAERVLKETVEITK